MGRKIAYFCDPEKNAECVNRDICFANPENLYKKLKCRLTTCRIFALTDEKGKPKVYKPYLRTMERARKRQKKEKCLR